MRARPVTLAAPRRLALLALLALVTTGANVALPASAGLTGGERLVLPPGASWASSRSDMAIGDDGTLAWVWTQQSAGQADVMVRVRAPGAATWSGPVRLDPPEVDIGAGPLVDVDRLGRAVVVWVEEREGSPDPVVVRRVDADGTPGPRLPLGTGAGGTTADAGRHLALDTNASGTMVVGFSDDAAGGRAAASTMAAGGALSPWRHLPSNGPVGAATSLDVAVDERGRTWAAWTASTPESEPQPFVARLGSDDVWIGRQLPGGRTDRVALESGHDVTALAWSGDGDGDSARDDVLTLVHDSASAPLEVPAGWDPVTDGRRDTILHRTSPMVSVHRSTAWLATRSLPGTGLVRTVDVRSTSGEGWGSPTAIPTSGDRSASAAGWLVTGDPGAPLLAVATLKPGGTTASRIDFFGPDPDGAWTSQRTVVPRVAAHSVHVDDVGAAHGALDDAFVVVTDDTDQPDRSSLLRLDAGTATPVTVVSPLSAWSLVSFRVAWTTDLPADLAEVRLRRARADGGFDAGTSITRSTSPYVVGALARGQSGCVTVRSQGAGGLGPWSPERCTARPLDDRDLTRSAGWTNRTGRSHYLGTVRTAARRGANLSAHVTAVHRLALVASTCRACGRVQVSLGGTSLGTIALTGPPRHREVLPVATFASPRSGTVRITVATSGKRVAVDGLGVSKR